MTTRVAMSCRDIRRCAVLLLVACLLADCAMPLLPGAFRLDPGDGVDAAATRAGASAVVLPDLHVSAADVPPAGDEVLVRRAPRETRRRPRIAFFRSALLRQSPPNDATPTSDDG